MASDGPIFVGGLSGSGKTPLRIALSTHSRISMSRRTYLWTRHLDRYGHLDEPENLDRCLEAMSSDPGILNLDPDLAAIRDRFMEGEATYPRLFALLHQQRADRVGKPRWGDQLGMVEAFADPIFEAFPTARMIHLVRDPRRSGRRAERRSIAPGKVGWSTARWLTSADLAITNQRRYPGRYLVVRYETLAAEPEATLGAIADFIDEELEPDMIEPLRAMEEAAPGRWRCPPTTAAFIERYAGVELDALAYRQRLGPRPSELGLTFHLVDRPVNRMGMVAWKTIGSRSTTRKARR